MRIIENNRLQLKIAGGGNFEGSGVLCVVEIDNDITIVSGLPRSGTSMMLKMLEAGGMELLTDGIRMPDVDNPKGYYELEKVKRIKADA